MTNIAHRSCRLWVSTSIGRIPRSGITGLKDMNTCNFVHYSTIIYPNPLLSIDQIMWSIVWSPTLTWFLTEWKESNQERSGQRNSRSLLAINMSYCPIKDASGSSWYPGHTAFVTLSDCLKAWTRSPGPTAGIISDTGRLTEERIFRVIQQIHGSLCFFQMDSELPQPNIVLGSATAAKWHDACHLHCGRYEWSSARPGQLCAAGLALCSSILRQEPEMVPGFLLSQQSCAGTVAVLQQ